MRYALLLLSVAIFGFSPAISHAAEIDTTVGMPAASSSETTKSFSDPERAAIEGIIKDYLAKHPDEIVQALQEMQKRDQVNAEEKSKTAVTAAKDKIYNNPDTPVGGNPRGDVSVVEFFDYQCGYCKMSEDAVEKLLKEDKNVRFVYKDFPILGPVSTIASKASLASIRQGKYIKLHDALMSKKDHLSEEMIYQVAKDIGLDVDKLKKDMNDDITAKLIQANLKLGMEIGVRGTPMFIVGENVFPGALQYEQLKKAVEDARAGKKN